MKSEPFSPVDAAWLHMDKPTNMALIVGVMMFDTPIGFEQFRVVVEQRFLIYDRFKQRVKEPLLRLGLPRWETDPEFDLDYHLQRISLPKPGNEAALQKLAGDLTSVPLDPKRPLWQFYFVENYGAGCAIIGRLHHCIADGLALVQVLLSMTDKEANAKWQALDAGPTARRGVGRPASPAKARGNVLKPAAQALGTTLATAEQMWHESLVTLSHPTRLIDAAKVGALGVIALGKLLLLSPDRRTLFKGRCGVPKHATWTTPIKLQDVKVVAYAFNATVNDVLLATVSGALRRYLEEHDGAVEGLNVRAMVPVSIRPQDNLKRLGNQFGLVILSLPVGVRDPIRRMLTLKKRMDEIKDTPEALVAFGLLGGMGVTPTQIEEILLKFFAAKVSAVMTNVPGPREPIYLAGQPLKRIMFWVPTPGNLALGVSIISYAGEVMVGIATDAGLAPNPDRIVAAFHEEFAHLQSWVRQPATLSRKVAQKLPASIRKPLTLCQGVTKLGQPCNNHALPRSKFCRVHQR